MKLFKGTDKSDWSCDKRCSELVKELSCQTNPYENERQHTPFLQSFCVICAVFDLNISMTIDFEKRTFGHDRDSPDTLYAVEQTNHKDSSC